MPRPIHTWVADRGSVTVWRGMSLVEIMIALVLGLFLIGGILQVLSSNRLTYRLAEAKARTQENGRYVLQFLSSEMRPSRSNLCRNIVQDAQEATITVEACALLADPTNCTGTHILSNSIPLGYSVAQVGTPDWLAGLPGTSDLGTRARVDQSRLRGDVLVSWGAVGKGFYARTNTLAQGNPSVVDLKLPIRLIDGINTATLGDAGFKGGHLAMITDCNYSDVFAISNSDGHTGTASLEHGLTRASNRVNKDAAVSHPYNDLKQWATAPRARVIPFDYRVFFICCMDQDTGEAQSGSGTVANCISNPVQYRPALCRWSATSGTAVIATDIADLRAVYDGRLDPSSTGDPVRFGETYTVPTAAVVQQHHLWDRVYSVRVELLVTGGDAVRATDVSPALAAPASTTGLGSGMADDKRLYETFSSTIAIRSRTSWYRDD